MFDWPWNNGSTVASSEYRLCDVVRCPALLSITPPPIVCGGYPRAQRRRSIFNAPRCNIDARPQLSVDGRCGQRRRHRHRRSRRLRRHRRFVLVVFVLGSMAAINADANVDTVVNVSGFIAVNNSSSLSLFVLVVDIDNDNMCSYVVFSAFARRHTYKNITFHQWYLSTNLPHSRSIRHVFSQSVCLGID